MGSSDDGFVGSRAVNCRDVIGNVLELGFPARSEMTPGACSRWKRSRTCKEKGKDDQPRRTRQRDRGDNEDLLGSDFLVFAASEKKVV